jgi:hypothetical protein
MTSQIQKKIQNIPPPSLNWLPAPGDETRALIDYLETSEGFSKNELETVEVEAISILGRCNNPNSLGTGTKTGLAIGYVQSGKTTSFMTLTALAADNKIPMVIVLAGTQTNLLEQSNGRFEKGLHLDRGAIESPWMVRSNPTSTRDHSDIRQALHNWNDPSFLEEEQKIVLVTVMKHHSHIANLTNLLVNLQDELENCNVLVIDDEGDQAGLNTAIHNDDESTTYANITEMRRRLPNHGYIMYTATPQAPLLLESMDFLSPDFAVVLTPGGSYTGGQAFFPPNSTSGLIEEIPDSDIVDPQEDVPEAPPKTLREAMQLFALGVSEGYYLARVKKKGPRNRTMMIHPSRLTSDHSTFTNWAKNLLDGWQVMLQLDPSEPDYQALIKEFKQQYKSLAKTVPGLRDFDEILPSLRRRIAEIQVMELNSMQDKTSVKWRETYSRILIGGQVLDRGFTVEGLTVTYMPRNLGVGNADTVQQRARFFGYKKSYIGYCRVYLHDAVKEAFTNYVEHEEHLHGQIREFLNTGKDLKEWRRQMFMSPAMQPTRRSVYRRLTQRGDYTGRFWWPRYPHADMKAMDQNIKLFHDLIKSLKAQFQEIDPDTTGKSAHAIAPGVPLKDLFEFFISEYQVRYHNDASNRSEAGYSGLCAQIAVYLDKYPNATAEVILMAGGEMRSRSVTDHGPIRALTTGSSENYVGDVNIGNPDVVRVQLTWLKLEEKRAGWTIEWVPVPIIFLPENAAPAYLIEQQDA